MDDEHPHSYPHLKNADGSEYTLEIGDTDVHGNKHPDHDKYEAEMEKRYIGEDKPKVEHHNDLNEIDGIPDIPF